MGWEVGGVEGRCTEGRGVQSEGFGRRGGSGGGFGKEGAMEEGERTSGAGGGEEVRVGQMPGLGEGERVPEGVARGVRGDEVGWVDEEGEVGGFAGC